MPSRPTTPVAAEYTDFVLHRRRAVGFASSASSGVLLVLAGQPAGVGLLGWVALVPLFVACIRSRRSREAALYGFVCGVVYFAVYIVWILNFGWMAYAALVAVMASYFAAAGWLASFFRRFPLAPVLLAGSWVGMELVRDRWPFGGFPWGALGTTQGAVPGVRWLAGSIGAYGLSFLLAFASALVADRLTSRSTAWGSLALVVAGLAVFASVDAIRYAPRGPGDRLTVVVVQADVPRPATEDQDQMVFDSAVRLTEGLGSSLGPDTVVVWPESAVGTGVPAGDLARIPALARSLDTTILVGQAVADPAARTFRNLVHQVGPDGVVEAAYQKQHPVPFGERVPLPFLRRYVSTLGQVPYDMQPGPGPVVFDTPAGRIGTPICFESVFPRDVRAFARAGAEVIVVSTNNASFERSYASQQHIAHSRMRALETRQWVVQAALSGISAVLAPDGTVSQRTALFEPDVVMAQVRARPARSLYVRVGDLFTYGWVTGTALAALLYVVVLAVGRRRTTHDRAGEPVAERAPLA